MERMEGMVVVDDTVEELIADLLDVKEEGSGSDTI
jgi:hypothetical protein